MIKLLNPAVHGALDYALAVLFLLAPSLFGYGGFAATLSYIIGVVYIAASLLTRYPLGAIKLIPFPVHGVLEAIMAASWIACPWVFGFAAEAAARNFFVIAGIGLLAVVALTDYKSTGARTYRGAERRHNLVNRRLRSLPVAHERRTGRRERRAAGFAA